MTRGRWTILTYQYTIRKKVRIVNEFTNITFQGKEKEHAYEQLR